MKKPALLAFAAGAMLSAAVISLTAFKQKDETPSYVTLNTWESPMGSSKLLIIYENGTVEETPLDNVSGAKGWQANAMKIHEMVNMLTHKGYRISTVVSKGSSCTYHFEKK
jgi:hypothetical protein